jgi:quaternary ammonium compound-resistance protein SugE
LKSIWTWKERTRRIDVAAFDALLRELERTSWNVGRDNAQLLTLLVKPGGAWRAPEVGTSNGSSTPRRPLHRGGLAAQGSGDVGGNSGRGGSGMAWIYLLLAGLLETGWAVGLKYTQGFTRLWPSVATVAAMALSFALLSQALKTIPLGTGYAVWTGIGAVGTAILGMVLFGESRDAARLACIALIVAGIAGLKWFSPH